MFKVYILMEDDWGSTFSQSFPVGIRLTKKSAQKWVEKWPTNRSYNIIHLIG